MKWVRRFFRFTGGLLLVLALLLLSLVTKQDETTLHETDFYREWQTIRRYVRPAAPNPADSLLAGWSKANITPTAPGPLAGYGKRKGKPYELVHDSVFVRTAVLKSGNLRAALVSADLLIIPPTVTARVKEKLTASDIPFENLYFGATHTHNSVGGWGTGISGLFFSGSYDPEVEIRIADAILASLRTSEQSLSPASLTYREANNTGNIRNRLIGDKGTIDPEIRAFELQKTTGERLTLATFGAHSTVLGAGTMQLSRDWPGILVDAIENQPAHFGMYMAGAVGSMAPKAEGATDFESMANQGSGVFESLEAAAPDTTVTLPVLKALTLPLPLGDANPRLTSKWALRTWVFNKAFGAYPNEVRALRIGNVLMVGVPCDFSGELMAPLDDYARTKGLNLIVTSFNGGYIGYVTDDKWYDLEQYETVTMNWFGPYKGAYFQEVIKDLVDLLD